MQPPAENALGRALQFLGRLEKAKIFYRLDHIREDTLMVLVEVPGQYWEVEFFQNGEIEIERFVSTGVKSADEDELNRLLKEQEDADQQNLPDGPANT